MTTELGIMIGVCGLGTVLAVAYVLILHRASEKYAELLTPLTESFRLLYPVGFWVLDAVGYKYESPFDLRRRKEAMVLNGRQFGEYYFRVFYAQVISLSLLIVPATFLACAIIGDLIVLFLCPVLVMCVWAKYNGDIKKKITVRADQFVLDFPEVLSKMTLLVNAGMILREAWAQVAKSGESAVYDEMRRAEEEMRNGVAMGDAILEFGVRSLNPNVKKFSSILVQNLSKGSADVVDFLLTQTRLNWIERKELVKQRGAVASNRLVIPITLMLVGIMIMIVVPLMAGMS